MTVAPWHKYAIFRKENSIHFVTITLADSNYAYLLTMVKKAIKKYF